MAPFTRKKSAGSSTPSSDTHSHSTSNMPPNPNDASPSAASAPPGSSAKKPSKMKRLLGSARRKKNGMSSMVITPSGISSSNKSLLSALESDETLPHSNNVEHIDSSGRPKQIPPKKQQHKSLPEIASLLQDEIEVRDRKYHLKTYKDCFVGSEVVDYLVENELASNRQAATKTAQEIMTTLRTFEHVTHLHDFFKDEYVFYCFSNSNNNHNNEETEAVETAPNYRRISTTGSGSGKSKGSSSGTGGIIKMDKYGFLLDDDRCSANADGSTNGINDDNLLIKVRTSDAKRWENILEKVPNTKLGLGQSTPTLSYSTSQSKVKYYARRGLPDSLRQKAWTVLTGVDLIMAENPGEYDDLVNKADEEYRKMHDHESADVSLDSACGAPREGYTEDTSAASNRTATNLETIERDLNRTFPKHYLFRSIPDDDGSDDENHNGGNTKMSHNASIQSEGFDSENAGSDDEDFESGLDDSAAEFDGIIQTAESTGQDPALFVEEKRRIFNESMGTLMNMSCVGFAGLAPIQDQDGDSNDIVKSAKESFTSGKTGGSDNSLDIFDDEEEDDDINNTNNISRRSMKSSSEALGLGDGQGALRRVLRAYCIYDSEVGYCQGMNFIAAMFLTFLSEEEAFWLLVVVMNEEPYKLRELFGEDMAGTHEVLYIAEKLLAQFLPKLSKHMEAESIHITMFVTQWLLTLYTSAFPFDLVARVWDCFLVEGWKVVYRVMLSLLEYASKDILDLRFEEILGYFREFPSTVSGQVIMAGSLKIPLKRKHIQKHVNEWRRHAGGGSEEQAKDSKSKRRNSGGSSVSSNTMNSHGLEIALPKLALPMKLMEKAPKEIVVENLSEQLLPVIGAYKFAVMLHNVLTPEECSELIDRAEENGFEDASIYDRRTNRAHRNCTRCVVDDLSLADDWYERIVDALIGTAFERKLMNAPWVDNRSIGKVHNAVSLNERLRLLRYKQGQFFHSHKDTVFVRGAEQGERAGETSFVSVQVYLNSKFKGGYTTFRGKGRHLDVKPKTGSILLFEHNILHEGQRVTHGKKYVVRTDIMYSTASVGFTSAASGTTLTQQL